MKVGNIIKFKDGLYRDEEESRYKVLELNGDRVIIEFICQLPIAPQSIANINELEIIETGNTAGKSY